MYTWVSKTSSPGVFTISRLGGQSPSSSDCGANIGLSALYFARVYPRARIIAFEPDPAIYPYLRENMALNHVNNARLMHAAVSARAGTMTLYSDGKYGSCLAEHASSDVTPASPTHEVLCVRLRDYLTERVDFLKMSIEGAEWEVLADSEDRLSQVDQMLLGTGIRYFRRTERTFADVI